MKNILPNLNLCGFGWRRREKRNEKTMEWLSRRLSTAVHLLPEGKFLVEYDGCGEVAIRMTWQQKQAHGIKPFAMSIAADSSFISLNKQNDGQPAFSILKDVEAVVQEQEAIAGVRQSRMMQRVKDFLTEHFLLRYNLITAQTECAAIDNVDAEGHHIYVGIDQRRLNSITVDAICEGIDCWDKDIKRCIESTKVAEYHPFMQYMDSLPAWDGKDRATEVAHLVSNNRLWTNAFHRWLLGMAAQWMQYGDRRYANSIAPMLISTRQGWGKSTFCRSLMPQCLMRYYTDNYDLASNARAEQKLTAFGLINIDEFDKLSQKQQPVLKNLMQMPSANIRRPYKQVYEPLPRIASFIATSNKRDLLTDNSGSRRFICIELEQPIDSSYAIDHDQLYAQLKHELLSGERYWLSKQEEKNIQRHNKRYYVASPIADIFKEMFIEAKSVDSVYNADAHDITDSVASKQQASTTSTPLLSAAEIYERMKKAHPAAMRGTTLLAFSKLLSTLAKNVHTKYGNGYRVEIRDRK